MMGQPGEEDLYPVQLPLVNCARGFKEEGDVKGIAGSNTTVAKVEGWCSEGKVEGCWCLT